MNPADRASAYLDRLRVVPVGGPEFEAVYAEACATGYGRAVYHLARWVAFVERGDAVAAQAELDLLSDELGPKFGEWMLLSRIRDGSTLDEAVAETMREAQCHAATHPWRPN